MTIIKIDDEIGYWGISARDIKDQLAESTGDIKVEFNSPGGSVVEGIEIFNAFKEYNKGKIEGVIVGMAASMATYISLACDKISAYDNAIYMIHNASGMAYGDYREMASRSNILKSMSNILKKAYVSKTGESELEIQKKMDEESWYFGEELLENGFVDEIIKSEKDIDEDGSVAVAKETFKACLQNVAKNSNPKEDEQIAAIIKDENLRVNSASAKITNQTEGESVEYTKEKFEALANTHAEAIEQTKNDVIAKERDRISAIMALHGADSIKKDAIEKGMSAGDCAIALNKAVDVAKTNFEEAAEEVASVKVDEPAEELSEIEKDKKEMEEAANAYYGGNK